MAFDNSKITKENVEQAIKNIDDNPELILGRQSTNYDLHYLNEIYPPILVLSEAHKLAGGNELTLSDFASTQKAFELLTNLGNQFQVKPKHEAGFSYVKYFQELAKELLNYHTKPKELIRILKEIGNQKNLSDFDGVNEIDLEEIDPFSFFAFFMKIKNHEKRQIAFRKLKRHFKIAAYTPDGFLGVPSSNAFSVWYFAYKDKRQDPDISVLWDLAEQAVTGNMDDATFQSALSIHAVGLAKLTQGLFFLDPERYYPIDSHSGYIESAGINSEVQNLADYNRILNEIKVKFNKPFYEISHDAWLADQNKCNYWIFQGSQDNYDIIRSINDEKLKHWKVKAHKGKIKTGDKAIIWISGENSGIYALASVLSEPFETKETEEEFEYNVKEGENTSQTRVRIQITDNLTAKPLLKDIILSTEGLEKIKAGTQGTNFQSNKEEYDLILELVKSQTEKRYWVYAPGEGAELWDECNDESLMLLGWDKLGDLNHYSSKSEIAEKLRQLDGSTGSKKNDAKACYDFNKIVKPGDVVFVKKGRSEYLGYGIVEGDYYYDDNRGYFKHCRKATWKKRGSWTATDHSTVVKTLTDITNYTDYVEKLKALFEYNESKKIEIMSNSKNIILYGPPGTGKTYHSIDYAVKIATGVSSDHISNKKVFDDLRKEGQIEFVTFHQNYSYEDFMVGIRPAVEESTLKFMKHKGIFYELVQRARENYFASITHAGTYVGTTELINNLLERLRNGEKISLKTPTGVDFSLEYFSEDTIQLVYSNGSKKNTLSVDTLFDIVDDKRDYTSSLKTYYYPLKTYLLKDRVKPNEQKQDLKNFVLVIDEINRANISKVFGELITLLEEDKRLGEENWLKITLPNGEKDFGVPPNVYIIGTMNTADKSIALIDIALRRRFEFIGKYPEYDDLIEEQKELLKKINTSIYEKKKSADYLIGHAYFMKGLTIENVLRNKVIPLLMEYFSGKTDIVGSVFEATAWTVKYNTTNYAWEISKK